MDTHFSFCVGNVWNGLWRRHFRCFRLSSSLSIQGPNSPPLSLASGTVNINKLNNSSPRSIRPLRWRHAPTKRLQASPISHCPTSKKKATTTTSKLFWGKGILCCFRITSFVLSNTANGFRTWKVVQNPAVCNCCTALETTRPWCNTINKPHSNIHGPVRLDTDKSETSTQTAQPHSFQGSKTCSVRF
jgi:hypothetical protein